MNAQNDPNGNSDAAGAPAAGGASDRLEGWKAIAHYLDRDTRTVQRWEQREGLPVHRHEHQRQATAFAYRSELEAWLRQRSPSQIAEHQISKIGPTRGVSRRWWLLGGLGAAIVMVSVATVMMRRAGPDATAARDTRDAAAYAAFAEGQALYAARRYQDAVVALDRAVSRDQRYWAAWALLARAHARLAPPAWAGGTAAADRATEAARRAAALAPDAADVHVALAMAARARGDVDEWRAEAQRATALDPRAAEAYALLGDSYSAMVYGCGREVDAERADTYYRRALELKPDLTTAVSNRATNLRRLGRHQECIDLAERALRSLSDEIPLRFVRGSCRLALGDLDGAAADLEPLRDNAKLSPVAPLVELGLLALKRGRTDDGIRDLEAAARIQPGAQAELFVAEAYAAAADIPHLAEHLRRAFAQDASCRGFVAASPTFEAVRTTPEIKRLLDGG